MEPLHQALLAVLGLSFVLSLFLFGRIPTFRNTPLGILHRAICIYTPRAAYRVDARLTGGRISKGASRAGHYLLYKRHPLVLIFFLTLLTSASALFLHTAWPLLSTTHHFIIPPLLATPYLATYLCASSTGSDITRLSHGPQLRAYPYDHTLFHPRTACSTCGVAKPARSKHCSLCGVCVARADHHCAWVNACVGRENTRWFLLLVASLATILPYAIALAAGLLRHRVSPTPINSPHPWRTSAQHWADVVTRDPALGGVAMLAGLTAPLAWGLLAYHMYLIYAGTTTNETGKWADLRDDIDAGRVWRASRTAVLGPMRSNSSSPNGHARHSSAPLLAPDAPPRPPLTPVFEQDEDLAESGGAPPALLNGRTLRAPPPSGTPLAAAERDAAMRWPKRSDQLVVRTRDGRAPLLQGAPRSHGAAGALFGDGAKWTRVSSLDELDNVYDLGFWGNLREVLFPRALMYDY